MNRLGLVLIFNLLGMAVGAQTQQVLTSDVFTQKLKATPQAQLLDVRTPAEFEAGHLPAARNVDWRNPDAFAQQTARLDKARPVFVYCQVGGRSKAAADWLTRQGFQTVYDLQGGFRDWPGKKEAGTGALRKSEKP